MMVTAPAEVLTANKRTCATIGTIIFALVVVPLLVRTAGPITPEDGRAPLLCLNRGVDVPESKCREIGASNHLAIIDARTASEICCLERIPLRRDSNELLTETPLSPSSVLRGPPLPL
jgi:hypothetical protein